MLIRIEGTGLPGTTCGPGSGHPDGHAGLHVAVQRRAKPAELLGLVPGDAPAATWTLDVTVTPAPDGGADVRGPYIQGPPGGRFVYLTWGEVAGPGTFEMFRRAKLWLGAVPAPVLRDAAGRGVLVGRLGLTDAKGHPRCGAVRPPLIEWLAAGT